MTALGTTSEDEAWTAGLPTPLLAYLVRLLGTKPRYYPPTRRVAILNEAARRLEATCPPSER